jgi:type VI protein secretion system component Hcp
MNMSGMRAFRSVGAAAVIGGVLLVAPGAEAANTGGPYTITATFAGVPTPPGAPTVVPPSAQKWPPVTTYTATSFHWIDAGAHEPMFTASFTHATDPSSVTLFALAANRQKCTVIPTVTITEVGSGGTGNTVTLTMTNVVLEVREEGNGNGPEETVVLRFQGITYSYQSSPAGQGAGPAYTTSFSRNWSPECSQTHMNWP